MTFEIFSISKIVARMFIVLSILTQVFILPASASSLVFSQNYHIDISGVNTSNEIEISVWVETDYNSRVNRFESKSEIGVNSKLFVDESDIAAKGGTQTFKSLGAAAKGFSKTINFGKIKVPSEIFH